jgi:hypothetical protein
LSVRTHTSIFCACAAELLLHLPFMCSCRLTSCQVASLLSDEELSHLSEAAVSGGADGGCWLPRRYKRVIWVVIDALRFDFAHWSDDGAFDGPSAFYHNRLPVLHEVLHGQQQQQQRGSGGGGGGADRAGNATAPAAAAGAKRALLYKFEADPPTVTMQVR